MHLGLSREREFEIRRIIRERNARNRKRKASVFKTSRITKKKVERSKITEDEHGGEHDDEYDDEHGDEYDDGHDDENDDELKPDSDADYRYIHNF